MTHEASPFVDPTVLLSQRQYLADNGDICPYCKDASERRTCTAEYWEDGGLCRYLTCVTCGASWREVYLLAHYDELTINHMTPRLAREEGRA